MRDVQITRFEHRNQIRSESGQQLADSNNSGGVSTGTITLLDDDNSIFLSLLSSSGVYIALRTVEKVLSKGWLKGTTLKTRKGDAEVELSSEGKGHESLH